MRCPTGLRPPTIYPPLRGPLRRRWEVPPQGFRLRGASEHTPNTQRREMQLSARVREQPVYRTKVEGDSPFPACMQVAQHRTSWPTAFHGVRFP